MVQILASFTYKMFLPQYHLIRWYINQIFAEQLVFDCEKIYVPLNDTAVKISKNGGRGYLYLLSQALWTWYYEERHAHDCVTAIRC